MKQSSVTTTTRRESVVASEREELLQKFALSATARPLDRKAVDRAREDLLETLGPEALVEASGVVGLYECFTKFVDATGKKANPSMEQRVMTLALGTQTWIYSFVSWFYSK